MCDNNESFHQLDDYRIALYYCYVDIDEVDQHVAFQNEICHSYNLMGRIRVSSEGLNGVLSGLHQFLKDYQMHVEQVIGKELHIKYCFLRKDLSLQSQLFVALSVKATREVVSLYEAPTSIGTTTTVTTDNSRMVKSPNANDSMSSSTNYRRRKRNRQRQPTIGIEVQQQHQLTEVPNMNSIPNSPHDERLKPLKPCTHLSPTEWNQHLTNMIKDCSKRIQTTNNPSSTSSIVEKSDNVSPDIIILDARNCYESRVGYFQVEGVPTLLTNTRKYSSLPQVLVQCQSELANKTIYMYCTGGVRCERASVFLQALDWGKENRPKAVFQLDGGIQRYLEYYGSESGQSSTLNEECLFRGKNFVFDPRRTDPVVGKGVVGQCLLCGISHDDYDNGKAPNQDNESRCCKCRVLVLVCVKCQETAIDWGRLQKGNDDNDVVCYKAKLYCGIDRCIDEGGNTVHATVVI